MIVVVVLLQVKGIRFWLMFPPGLSMLIARKAKAKHLKIKLGVLEIGMFRNDPEIPSTLDEEYWDILASIVSS